MSFNWTCPYCSQTQTVTRERISSDRFHFLVGETAWGFFGLEGQAICCSNPDCLKVTVDVSLLPAEKYSQYGVNALDGRFFSSEADPMLHERLIPRNSAKPQPDFIPIALRQDYIEACEIRDLSPKASATLARRCLQGMIRDFCEIRKGRLVDEINELQKRVEAEKAPKGVSAESVEAIDHVRKIGNIGAHMEKDINTIIDVDPQEAQILIELIESLFDEWYVERERRKKRFEKLGEIAAKKEAQKQIAQEKPIQIKGPE